MKKKVLITGSSGFIGKNAVEYFCNKGYSVKLADIKDGLDLRILQNCYSAASGVDIVVHLAADNGGYFYLDGNEDVPCNNRMIDSNMIMASKLNNVKHFFFMSSSCVYPLNNPQNEYGIAKLQTEKLLKNSGLNYSIMRLQNAFGKYETIGGKKEKVIPSFIRQINKGKVKVYGGGLQERSFIYAPDLCEIIEKMIKNKIKIKDIGGEILNMREILYSLIAIANKKVKVKFGKHVDDRKNFFPKSSSKTNYHKAIKETYKWTTKQL